MGVRLLIPDVDKREKNILRVEVGTMSIPYIIGMERDIGRRRTESTRRWCLWRVVPGLHIIGNHWDNRSTNIVNGNTHNRLCVDSTLKKFIYEKSVDYIMYL